MNLAIITLWVAATGSGTCELDLRGDTAIVAQIRDRLDLAWGNGVSCAPIQIRVADRGDRIAVTIEHADGRMERVMADVAMASVLIESRLFVPDEARHRPRRVVRPTYVDSAEPYRRDYADEGPEVRLGSAAEMTVTDDGALWYGPSVEAAISDGAWTAGVALRYARTDARIGGGFMFEVQPLLGRDFVWSWGSFEPRVGFSIRTMQRSVASPWISPCGSLTCPAGARFTVDVPTASTASLGMAVDGRATFVVHVTGPVSAWASAGIGTTVALRDGLDESSATPDHLMAAGRFSLGGRFSL